MIDLKLKDSTIIWSEPGVQSEPFLYELIQQRLSNKKKVVLFVVDKQPSFLKKEA